MDETPCQEIRRMNKQIDECCEAEYLRGLSEGRRQMAEEVRDMLIQKKATTLTCAAKWRAEGVEPELVRCFERDVETYKHLLNEVYDLSLLTPPEQRSCKEGK